VRTTEGVSALCQLLFMKCRLCNMRDMVLTCVIFCGEIDKVISDNFPLLHLGVGQIRQ
jgi:hypothetical protein